MFHSFHEADEGNVEALCQHIALHFEPVTLSAIVEGTKLPKNAITVTIDDGYRNFLQHGHPIFRRHGISTTIYAVSGFADQRLWLWPDQVAFAIDNSGQKSLDVSMEGRAPLLLTLTSAPERRSAAGLLTEALKQIPNQRRLAFLATLPGLCKVEIPFAPPPAYAALSWDELRALAAEGVEIGCHTETHPILSRISNPDHLRREIRGAKEEMEQRLGFTVRHFCYPNGKTADVGNMAIECVRDSGYASAVTCSWGLNSVQESAFQIRRVPLDSQIDSGYAVELLAGLHMPLQ